MTFLLAAVASVVVTPWVGLSWWKVFRRCVSIGAALSLWYCVTRIEQRSIRSYGLPVGQGASEIFRGVWLGAAGLGLLVGLGLTMRLCQIHITPDHAKLWRTVIGFIPGALLVSVLEELVFRGFVLQQLLRCSGTLAVVTSSMVYALVHVRSGAFGLMVGRELVGLFLLGLVLACCALRTQRLYLAIGLHAVFAYGARVNKVVLSIPSESLVWLTGTSRLINGVASWGLLGVVALVVLWWTRSAQQGGLQHGQV